MASRALPPRRPRISEIQYDDDRAGDDSQEMLERLSPLGSAPSTHTRTGEYTPRYPNPDLVLPKGYRSHEVRSQDNTNRSVNRSHGDQHQPGAILRVKLTNFVTYENAVFYPGPNLNMVIGPNGTGKSSLVCAICLGLGYSPSHLGRAAKVGEFVNHGKDDATIEIELQRRQDEVENYVVKVRIIRDGDKRKWWINGSETSLKSVQAMTKLFGIQVDNLCQFLPQDRVSEFAGLNPIELLHETQRAAAPEEMLVWHEALKKLRKEQKALQLVHGSDQETLSTMEERQEGLRGDVERLQERAQIQERIALLEKTVPFVEYKVARNQHLEHRQRKVDAQKRLKELESQVEPTLCAVNSKEQYQAQIDTVVKERRKILNDAERASDVASGKVGTAEERIKDLQQTQKAELDGERSRKQELQRIQSKINELQARLQNAPPAFDSAEWNARIRAKEHRVREVDNELREFGQQDIEAQQAGNILKKKIADAENELTALESQAGKQVNKLKQASFDTARAWEWIRENRDQFEHPIYGPPLVECSVKDPRYVDAIESLFQRNDFLAITTQSRSDFRKLNDQLYGTMKLADVTIKTITGNLADHNRQPASSQKMEQFGFDGWVLDFLDGPDAVLAMLCMELRVNSTGIALRDVSEDQFNAILRSSVTSWVAGRHNYRVFRRREYGPGATSTSTKNVRPARMWTDQPVDLNSKRDIQENITGWQEEFESLKAEVSAMRAKMDLLKTEKKLVKETMENIKTEKNQIQIAAGQYATLPDKITREKENLERKKQLGEEFRQRTQQLLVQLDSAYLEKTTLALEHKAQVERLRACHETLLEAEIRHLEAESDVEALKARNSGIARQLEDERRLVSEVERNAKEAKEIAANALTVCRTILAEAEGSSDTEYFTSLSQDLRLEDLKHDIEAEQAKLDYIHGGNAGALKEFESRKAAMEKLSEKLSETARKLEKMDRKVTELREKWEPELDRLVKEISNAFAYNFEQIGCAGEVGVHKDPDFDLWSIEIKVKFREHETLQLLDQHRQSGGERSVSTIFYLMSLQSLARAPFRVVDEINQGMDPRNERMVHERMVEIACKEHTSQYFLITPKLLTGLKYDPRMKVLCIASGEYMPADYRQLNVRKAIKDRRSINATAAAAA